MYQRRLKDAALEYLRKRNILLRLEPSGDGFYRAPEDDWCPACRQAAWSVNTGAHLKTLNHIAAKHEVDVRELRPVIAALREQRRKSSDYAFKKLEWNDRLELLQSPTSDFDWVPEAVALAECARCAQVPGDGCGCGFWCFWELYDALEYDRHDVNGVVVKLKIGGEIIEGTQGCRAEAAVIVGIWSGDHPDIAKQAAEKYFVPLFDEPFEESFEVISGKEDDDELWA